MNTLRRILTGLPSMIAAVFTAIIVLLSRLVHAWFFSKEEPEGFGDGAGDNMCIETKGIHRSAMGLGDLNYLSGKIDSGLDPFGLYEDEISKD